MLVLPEDWRVGFAVDPALDGTAYRISIGDVSLADIAPTADDASGVPIGGRVLWRDLPYFDSARGPTPVLVESRLETSDHAPWLPFFCTSIYVLPSKLGEDRYDAMRSDLDRINRSLLMDLYGKSRQSVDIKYMKGGRRDYSRDAELHAIETTLARIEPLLRSIAQSPASRIVTARHRRPYWGDRSLPPVAINRLASFGIDLKSSARPVHVTSLVKTETFDVQEHRIINAFLELLIRRATYCTSVAASHAQVIASEKHLRNIQFGGGPTIYESVDLPRIAKLRHAVATGHRCESMAWAMRRLAFLRDVPGAFATVRGGMFQRNNDYRELFAIIRGYLLNHLQWHQGDDYSSITKLTWRIFEQWTFLRVVDAFRNAGVELHEWADILHRNLRSRFIVDFDRGMMFQGSLTRNLRIRFRYEPWILGHGPAVRNGETLYRGHSEVPWCPDIVIECLRWNEDGWVAIYAMVLDCKYTSRVSNQHWSGVEKYLEIRSTATRKQVVRQLWLVAPSGVAHIDSEDPAVDFSRLGPSCDASETVRFRLKVKPEAVTTESEPSPAADAFNLLAEGMLAFLRRSLCDLE